jgi:hypothetical protein
MTTLLLAMVLGGMPPLEVEATGHVFTSTEGVEVAVAALRSPGAKRALVRITRTGTTPASKVWLAQVWESLEISVYRTKIGKKEHELLITRAGFPVVFLPEDGREVAIDWSEQKTHALEPRHLLEEYLRQEKAK